MCLYSVPLPLVFKGKCLWLKGTQHVMNVCSRKKNMRMSLRCADSGVLATTPNVMASLQAHHALLYLGLNVTALKQRLLLWDGLSMKQRLLAFEKDTDCPVCQAR